MNQGDGAGIVLAGVPGMMKRCSSSCACAVSTEAAVSTKTNAAPQRRTFDRGAMLRDPVAGKVPAASGIAAGATHDPLLGVPPFHLGEFQTDVVYHPDPGRYRLRHVTDYDVVQLDFLVLDPVALAVGTKELELRFRDRPAHRAVLGEDR